jgi:Luciferase-like monooxygenase
VWSVERNLRFEGKHYYLRGAHSGPVPGHPIGIWLGVYGPRALRLAGQKADGWVPSFRGDPKALADMAARVKDGPVDAGRDPASIRRILNVNGQNATGASEGMLHGPVDQWVDELTDLAVSFCFDTFVLWAEGEDQLARFSEDVVPAVRHVTAKRNR